MAINCAALPEALLESELFGFKAGAFTGAERDKKGLIEEAEGGTLFLDEVTELPLLLQAKLLRVIQEKELMRVGENITRKVDFRVLSASHKKLSEEVRAGKFREDLFFRLCEMELELPALRERKEDIPLLAKEFIQRFCDADQVDKPPKLTKELLQAFLNYDWPGNVREFESFIKVALALRSGALLQLKDLPESYLQRLGQKRSAKKSLEKVPEPSQNFQKPDRLNPNHCMPEARNHNLSELSPARLFLNNGKPIFPHQKFADKQAPSCNES